MNTIQTAEIQSQVLCRQAVHLASFPPSLSEAEAGCIRSSAHSDACQHKRVPEMLHAVTWKDELKAESALLMHRFT